MLVLSEPQELPLPLEELQGHQIAGGVSRCHVGVELVRIDFHLDGVKVVVAPARRGLARVVQEAVVFEVDEELPAIG